MNFKKGFVLVVLGLLAWSIIEIAGSFVYRSGASPLTLLVVRFLIACPLFFLTLLLWNRQSLRVEKQDIGKLAFHSSILVVHLITFWQGLKILSHVPTFVVIYISYPIWIAFSASLFLGQKFTKLRFVSLVLGSLGILFGMRFLPSFSLFQVNLVGGLLTLAAALTWAWYVLVGKSLLKKYSPFVVLFYNFVFCLVVFLLLQNPAIVLKEVTSQAIPYLVIMGIVSTYLAYFFYYLGLQYIRATSAGVVGFVKPFVTIILAYFLLQQSITLLQVLGGGLTIAGVYLISKEQHD